MPSPLWHGNGCATAAECDPREQPEMPGGAAGYQGGVNSVSPCATEDGCAAVGVLQRAHEKRWDVGVGIDERDLGGWN